MTADRSKSALNIPSSGTLAPEGSIELRSGAFRVVLQPFFGGRVLAFYKIGENGHLDWLQPASAATDPVAHVRAGCFPMVPYCNRVARGRLTFEGRDYDLDGRHPWPEACHGHGFLVPWIIEGSDEDEATIAYRYDSDDWPSAYIARQTFRLRAGTLTIGISVRNTGSRAMPCGFGFHPYFPKRGGMRVLTDADSFWPVPETAPPEWPSPTPFRSERDLPTGPARAICLNGWTRVARIEWEDAALELAASPEFGRVTIFEPADGDIVCIEPCSHDVGGPGPVDPGRQTGICLLEPGDALSGTVSLRAISADR